MFESEFMRLAFGAGAIVGVLAPACATSTTPSAMPV